MKKKKISWMPVISKKTPGKKKNPCDLCGKSGGEFKSASSSSSFASRRFPKDTVRVNIEYQWSMFGDNKGPNKKKWAGLCHNCQMYVLNSIAGHPEIIWRLKVIWNEVYFWLCRKMKPWKYAEMVNGARWIVEHTQPRATVYFSVKEIQFYIDSWKRKYGRLIK